MGMRFERQMGAVQALAVLNVCADTQSQLPSLPELVPDQTNTTLGCCGPPCSDRVDKGKCSVILMYLPGFWSELDLCLSRNMCKDINVLLYTHAYRDYII